MQDNFYLKKYGFQEPQIKHAVDPLTELIVVIPCFNEPDLVSSLRSLANCEFEAFAVEVITVINAADDASESVLAQNKTSLHQAKKWLEEKAVQHITFHFIEANDLPKKHAGVGLARKIGMDEAVARFHSINKDGVIVMYDADSKCDPNYLQEIYNHFKSNPKTPGCAIYFEHPLFGNEYDAGIYEGISKYELFLRYYYEGLKLAELPFAFHTVGSSMAVRSSAYQKQGGMNKRKAGEDFYFAQKIIELGNYTELNSTRVIPSPRTSDRVPFGTGKAINDWMNQETKEYYTYHSQTFFDLRDFVRGIDELCNSDDYQKFCSEALQSFLNENELIDALVEIRKNSSNLESFRKRFFIWFNAFRVLKFVHYARDNYYDQARVEEAAGELLNLDVSNLEELLLTYRKRHLE